jgi:UDP:flavonoid glycosyltransferase YjiC (YdhE family)
MIPDIPDQIRILSWFPFYIRKLFIKYLPKFIKRRLSPLRQPNIRWAARKVGCKKKIVNFFDMLQADLTLVNDMPDFYTKYNLPENVVVTGPIFSRSKTTEVIDKNILGIFDNKNKRVKIFCTLGTSGTAEQLEEVAKVFIEGVGQNWDAVILSPVAVCLMDRIKKIINGRKGVYVTDSFVPAEMIAQMADIVICHGGQGTIQNAMCAGTPLVGVSTQAEQFLNLWNIEAYGAGIKVSTKKWKAKNIQDSVLKILSHQSFNESALRMKEKMRLIDGEKNSAITFWKKLDENGYIPKSLS